MHYLNIIMRNVVKVFHKDTVLGNGSGIDEEALNLALEEEARAEPESSHGYFHHELLDFLFLGAEGGGALGSSGALKSSTHPVMAIFLYPLKAKVEADCALEVEAMGAMDLVEVEAVGALDLVEAVGALDLVEGALDHVEV
ncbi:hypothetical protein Tco_0884185 [Tanacetum coccineum]